MGRPKNFERTTVIRQALEAFWANGYAATSLRDLTEVTGLNKKSLYNEFGSKEKLFNITLDYYNQKRGPLVSLLNRDPLGRQNIIDFFYQLVEETDKKGCLLCLSINERDLLEKKAYRGVKDDFDGLKSLFELNLKHSGREQKKSASSLSLLLCSQIFAIAGMGKLKIKREDIKKSIEHLLRGSL